MTARFLADTWWGIAAALWISTGLARAFGGLEKGAPYYLQNHLFLTTTWRSAAALCVAHSAHSASIAIKPLHMLPPEVWVGRFVARRVRAAREDRCEIPWGGLIRA